MNKLEQAARQAFETWWEREGQEFLYALNTTTDDDIKLVAEIAWKNGAYCAEQAEQKPVAVVEITYGREPECYVTGNIDDFPEGVFKLYAAPVRTKDLTDDEIADKVSQYGLSDYVFQAMDMCRAVIAAFKEKNK